MLTCPILARERGLRAPINQVRLLWLLKILKSKELAAATTSLLLRGLLLLLLRKLIQGLFLHNIRLHVFTAGCTFI